VAPILYVEVVSPIQIKFAYYHLLAILKADGLGDIIRVIELGDEVRVAIGDVVTHPSRREC
jgi:hypothetical protein